MKPTRFADGGALAQHGGVHVLAGLRVVPGPLPLADVLEQGAVGDVPGVDRGEPRRVEQLAALASGQGRERHRGVRRPVGGGADLARDVAGRPSAAAMTPIALTPEVLPWSLAVLIEV